MLLTRPKAVRLPVIDSEKAESNIFSMAAVTIVLAILIVPLIIMAGIHHQVLEELSMDED